MGGNNPAVVLDDAHLKQAVVECVRAGFATTGQRCTCTRRIIVHSTVADQFIHALVEAARRLTFGPPRSEPAVFMGPLINDASVTAALDFQNRLVSRGGKVLLEARRGDEGGHFISPGIVEVGANSIAPGDEDHDCEVFGPIVQVSRCADLDDAIRQANATQYGLAAAIFTADESNAQRFFDEVRAGCINWNTGTAGASSQLAFGGLGMSGNHRPAGAFSVDYCSYPVASMVESSDGAAVPAGMTFDDAWLK
jgi:succinylglutamic semialdehyde dehydrogenase